MSWDLFRRPVPIPTLAVVVFLALVAGTAVAESRCVSLVVDGPLLLPDGSLHEPGSLTLCRTMDYSPVSSLHKTYVNGRAVGMLRSRRSVNESDGWGTPVVRFRRDAEGRLALTGYALSAGGSGMTYRFDAAASRKRTRRPVVADEAQAVVVLSAAVLD